MNVFMLIKGWIQEGSVATAGTEGIPFSQRFRDSWGQSTAEHQVLFWIILAGFVSLVMAVVIVHWLQQRKHRLQSVVEDPRLLFEDMLVQFELSDEDKRVLRQMVSQARLKHPAVCLLSPGLLGWSQRLWQAEKGNTIAPEALRRIETISERLYGSSTASVH